MVKKLIETHINKIFKDLEVLATEVAEKEVKKRYSNKISELTVESVDREVEVRMTALAFQLSMLQSVVAK